MPSQVINALGRDEFFVPTGHRSSTGRVIGKYPINETTGRGFNQYEAIRRAQTLGGYILSLKEDARALEYVRDHLDIQYMRSFYESLTTETPNARLTRTQIHNLTTKCPVMVNIKYLHPTIDVAVEFEEIVEVPFLPNFSGYIQELDEATALPIKVGRRPNEKFQNTYFLEFVD